MTTLTTTIARLEKFTWPVVYAGLFLVIVGVALQRNGEDAGVPVIVVGALVAVIGAALVWWRSRIDDTL